MRLIIKVPGNRHQYLWRYEDVRIEQLDRCTGSLGDLDSLALYQVALNRSALHSYVGTEHVIHQSNSTKSSYWKLAVL